MIKSPCSKCDNHKFIFPNCLKKCKTISNFQIQHNSFHQYSTILNSSNYVSTDIFPIIFSHKRREMM
jgi:hypothetical protein